MKNIFIILFFVMSCQNYSATQLTTDEKNKNFGTPDLTPIQDMPVNYQTLTNKILKPKCLKCHNSNSSDLDASVILFYPYTEMQSQIDTNQTPDQSKLYKLISSQDDDRMPPPEVSGPLTANEIEFVRKWLEKGSPEF